MVFVLFLFFFHEFFLISATWINTKIQHPYRGQSACWPFDLQAASTADATSKDSRGGWLPRWETFQGFEPHLFLIFFAGGSSGGVGPGTVTTECRDVEGCVINYVTQ